MVLTIAPGHARWAARVRFAVLALLALVLGHTIVYAGEAGSGQRFAEAMSANGHDGWWLQGCALIVIAAVGLLLRSIGLLARLGAAAAAIQSVERPSTTDPQASVRGEVLAIWRRLLPAVVVLFALQENVEQVAAHGRLPGIDVLIGPTTLLVVPALAIVTLVLATLGALVRWRIATLGERIREAARLRRRIVRAARITHHRRAIGDLAPRRWMVDRLDAGRAPPFAARP